jgi:nanoRNase/pAp phosphatase (c-di-AMP/oligoRNAs hydrolase)
VKVTYDEIVTYSPKYNPVALIQFDMLQIEGVKVAIVFKTYNDGKITAAIRANSGSPIAGKIATKFGGGGHDYASGFKIIDSQNFNDLKIECINYIENQITNN